MTNKSTKISAKLLDVVSLIDENEVKTEMGEAFASFMLNPTVTWAKFILTDDKTNANGERIPKEEFANLIRSGIHMPVKMALGEISAGHPGTKPLGTITHLKETTTEDGGFALVALAALWGDERPADVEFIKQRFAEQKPVDVSWEILYTDSTLNTETQSMDLLGTVLRAATIVGNPAYTGRTPFLSIAAKKLGEAADVEEDPTKLAEEELKTIEELQADLDAAQAQLTEAKAKLDAANSSLADKDAEIGRLTTESNEKETELTSLREYKEAAEAEAQKAEKLGNIKAKFVEAGLEKDEEYFANNEETLLAMSESQLDFMVQELKAFATEASSKRTDASKKKIPVLTGGDDEEITIEDLVGFLNSNRGKK